MIRISPFMLAPALAMAGACASASGGHQTVGKTEYGVAYELRIDTNFLERALAVGTIWSSRQGRLPMGLAEIRNRTSATLRVRTHFRWENKYGMPLPTPGSVPEYHELAPYTSLTLSNVAPSERAHGFRLEITQAD